jgi:hypothetical protein
MELETEFRSLGGKGSENAKPMNAAVWKTAAGQMTEKPARGMNPEVRTVAG